MLDECHLNWGNIIGYVWGKTNKRIKIDIKNEKERQTYYGALDYGNKEFLMKEYSGGNSENTIKFLEYLQKERKGQRIIVMWDGAKYHCSEEIKKYLEKINEGKEEKEWQVTCIKFAPNAPEQNPVEDIWLQGKNFVRKFYKYCQSFVDVKYLFKLFIHEEIFSFEKIFEYDFFTQLV
jgi:transposase